MNHDAKGDFFKDKLGQLKDLDKTYNHKSSTTRSLKLIQGESPNA
ncbi:hypothetical protein SLEP1_g6617 [Rubroshorea leprosula]|uniref:Uncharacterized protein n=1 Tax=Rubroshorea leprosula TaxID=152421 RepID=A0AAV5I4Q7_9ROSI|nr:hypothetical protein SLEP1_g6617 [Rubroshorea leprosula]